MFAEGCPRPLELVDWSLEARTQPALPVWLGSIPCWGSPGGPPREGHGQQVGSKHRPGPGATSLLWGAALWCLCRECVRPRRDHRTGHPDLTWPSVVGKNKRVFHRPLPAQLFPSPHPQAPCEVSGDLGARAQALPPSAPKPHRREPGRANWIKRPQPGLAHQGNITLLWNEVVSSSQCEEMGIYVTVGMVFIFPNFQITFD